MRVEGHCTCMCAYIVCAFVPSFVKSFQTWLACNQMHFPPNCQKWRMNQSRAAWEQGGGKVRWKIGGGRLKVRDQKNGCSFCCVHSKHMLHTRYDSLRSLPRCLIGVEKEFFLFFLVNYVNSGVYHSHAEVIVYGGAWPYLGCIQHVQLYIAEIVKCRVVLLTDSLITADPSWDKSFNFSFFLSCTSHTYGIKEIWKENTYDVVLWLCRWF